MINNPTLSLDKPFLCWIDDLEVKWHTRSEAHCPCNHIYTCYTHENLKARLAVMTQDMRQAPP